MNRAIPPVKFKENRTFRHEKIIFTKSSPENWQSPQTQNNRIFEKKYKKTPVKFDENRTFNLEKSIL